MALHSMNSVLLATPNQIPVNFSKPSSKISSNVISSPLKKVLVPIGFGSEEMEAAIIVNVLRRAGANVLLASVEEKLQVECSSGTKIEADVSIQDCVGENFDLVALPGGMPGSVRLRDSDALRNITTKQAEEKRIYGAICAAPAVTLKPWGLLKKKQITCHPAFMDKIPSFRAVKSNIQVSGELTTSRGPGTTFEFALSFVEQLFGNPLADAVGEKLLTTDYNGHKKEEFNRVDWLFDHTPRVLIPIANGCEEIEVVILADILRRAKVDVVLASVEKSMKVVAFQHMKIIADKSINEASESIYDLIVLPSQAHSSEGSPCPSVGGSPGTAAKQEKLGKGTTVCSIMAHCKYLSRSS